jgi:hypothetical protein
MMAEPEHARGNEADHQRDERLRVGVNQIQLGAFAKPRALGRS